MGKISKSKKSSMGEIAIEIAKVVAPIIAVKLSEAISLAWNGYVEKSTKKTIKPKPRTRATKKIKSLAKPVKSSKK